MGPVVRVTENFVREISYVYWLMLVALGIKTVPFRGLKIPIKSYPQLWKVRKSLLQGRYEQPEVELLGSSIRPDDIVLELGAGAGVVSAIIGKKLGPKGRLYSYEANPALKACIEAISQMNGLSNEVRIAAVGLTECDVEFFFDDAFVSSSKIQRVSDRKATVVGQKSIVDLYEEVRPTVLVMDVEGAEVEILTAMIPNSVRAVYAEFHPHILGDEAITKMLNDLFAQGFSLVLDKTSGRVVALERK